MKVLVTGSGGFVGKNLTATLNALGYEVLSYDRDNTIDDLKAFVAVCDFVVHLAGINRPKDPSEFYEGNAGFTETMTRLLFEANNKAPILISSSIQASLDNDYGKSKHEGEQLLLEHEKNNGSRVYIYRFSNLFGKWSRPNYNSVIATWCHNISRDMPIQINDPSVLLTLEYIDDVVKEIIRAINGSPNIVEGPYCEVAVKHHVTLGFIASTLEMFKQSRQTLRIANMKDDFTRKLYSTYLSYMPKDDFSYPLTMHKDERGSFTEFIKTEEAGQVSVNISKPGIIKGQHWHHTKNEKFLVVSGQGLIQFRDIFSDEVIEYKVSGEKLEVVDIPTGYTHNIINTGDTEMVTVMWVNEVFDPENPDTYYLEV